jgi:hypothetical protein
MRVVRIIGWIFMALAATALGAELTRSLAAGEWTPLVAGHFWFSVAPGGINLAQAITQRYLHPAVWDPLAIGILQFPLWIIPGFFGVAFLAVGSLGKRERKRRWFARRR